ncbi:MAG: hypothetical protein A3H98_12065 [Bacteroidetes bacterium RIFCSPLOWO2_02_FULL_36_8]|nr:MAG: hypothetical protein A3H98_12065 [Bacteroidetes bacterium RIFCSPLOWO2_02_FULL_36_8]OFY71299.1 MAG: hypothetical protein A3G23_02070 [Bacteroidetes bacterium RIFCSPLOWO2_12_FULL_37_12]
MLTLISICLFIQPAFSQKQKSKDKKSTGNTGYEIKVKIRGLKDTICLLANYYGDKQYLRDTAKVDKEGLMVFEGDKKLPGGIYLVVLPDKRFFELIMDSTQIFYMETDTSRELQEKVIVNNSAENSVFYEYLKWVGQKQKEDEPLRKAYRKLTDKKDSSKTPVELTQVQKDSVTLLKKQLGAIEKEVHNFKTNFMKEKEGYFIAKVIKASSEPDVPEAPLLPNGRKDSTWSFNYYKSHYLANIDFSDGRILYTPIFHNKLKFYFSNLVIQIPDSIKKEADMIIEKASADKELFKYIVWYITNTYETSNIMGMDAVFVHMVEKYYITHRAYWVDSAVLAKITDRALTVKNALIGNLAPGLVMKNLSGKDVSLYSVNAKYTCLVFWDSDCGHCKKEIPILHEKYKELKALGLEVFAVNIEQKEEGWKKFIEEKGLTDWINVNDMYHRTNFRKLYDIYSTPVVYVLDKEKKILAKRIGVEQVADFIKRISEKEVGK